MSCSWPPGLHTYQGEGGGGGFVPLLFADPLQVIKVLRLMFGSLSLQLPSQIFNGIKVCSLATPGP